MKSNFLVLFLSFLTLSSAAIVQSTNAQISRALSAKTMVIENKQVMSYILDMIEFDASRRLVSKDFKKSHDQYCAYYLSKIDSRLKNYLNDIRVHINDENHYVPSRIVPTLRLEVPLYLLFSKYLKIYSSNIVRPPAQIQNGEQDAATLRMIDISEGRNFIKQVMRTFTRQVFGPLRQNPNNPAYLLYLYILAKSCLDPAEFAQIEFPTNALILDAVNGRYPNNYCEEIFRDFDAPPALVHDELNAGRTNLARIMLNKPGTSNMLATYTDPRSHMNILHHCASIGAVDLIDRSLELGANPSRIDLRQFKPIHFAIVNGHFEAVKRLFRRDQDVVYSSSFILSPMLMALHYGQLDVIELFFSDPKVTLIDDPLLSAEIAQITLDSGNSRLAKILWNSEKLDLSDEISHSLYLLTL